MKPERDAVVIGAGPAGLMAAETLASRGVRVTVFDRMPSVGRKFLMAGRGGLNLTHSEPLDRFLARYGAAEEPLRIPIAAFPPDALRAWAGGLGEPTLVGSSGRVFPQSWKASPLLRAWLGRLDGLGVTFALRHRWLGFEADGALSFDTPVGPVSRPPPAATILALGGASWPRLGSDGGWASILTAHGVAISPLLPANCGILVEWTDWFRMRHEGEALKRVALSCGAASRRGEVVVTARGLEGGAVYGVSGGIRDALAAGSEPQLLLDLRPDATAQDLAARLSARLANPVGKPSWASILRKAIGLRPVDIALLREVRRDLPHDPGELAAFVKAIPLAVTGLAGIDRAISTAGGVRFDALDDRFMLKAMPGVFCAGEMLDWEAPTGGYLLQACFATGLAAAEGAHNFFQRSVMQR